MRGKRSGVASWLLALSLAGLALLGGCRRDDAASAPASAGGARDPAQAVLLLSGHLRRNDLAAFARDAVPPELAAPLESAWRAGRSRWPLEELPFDERLPGVLAALAAPGSEARLQQLFEHQFADENAAITAAAKTLGLFGARYVRNEATFSDDERAHYLQLVEAVSEWGAVAPLGEPKRARAAIGLLAAAARRTGLAGEDDFARAGMAGSLQRLSWFLPTFKQVLSGYGLDLDAALAGMRAEVVSSEGDQARVRMRYTLAGHPLEVVIAAERIGGRWYLSDFLRHARAAAAPPPARDAEPAAGTAGGPSNVPSGG